MALVCALVALFLPATASAAPTAQASIVGGHASSIAEFPSLSYIEAHQGNHGFACTGTVVAPRVVLTAAHCVESLEHGGSPPTGDYALSTGVADPTKAGRQRLPRHPTHVFPGFDPASCTATPAILDPRPSRPPRRRSRSPEPGTPPSTKAARSCN